VTDTAACSIYADSTGRRPPASETAGGTEPLGGISSKRRRDPDARHAAGRSSPRKARWVTPRVYHTCLRALGAHP
jgi:hypothetical protein